MRYSITVLTQTRISWNSIRKSLVKLAFVFALDCKTSVILQYKLVSCDMDTVSPIAYRVTIYATLTLHTQVH